MNEEIISVIPRKKKIRYSDLILKIMINLSASISILLIAGIFCYITFPIS